MNVLIIEDDPLMRELLVAALESRGHETTSYSDAESALAALERSSWQLVLLDWMLPGMDGLTLCRHLRQRPQGEHVVVLIVTARDHPDDLRAVLAAGADDYLQKPLDPHRLMVRLEVAESRVRLAERRLRAEDALARTLSELRGSRDDLRSILDQMRHGSVMIGADGCIGFRSAGARALLAVGPDDDVDLCDWRTAFPFPPYDIERLAAAAALPPGERAKVPVSVELADEKRCLEVDVHDDPRDPRGKILVLYDVTELVALRQQLVSDGRYFDLVGRSPAMQDVFQLVEDVAAVDTTVLIEGETGTGKELVARAVHLASDRRAGAFVPVNCAGLTESLVASQLFGHARGAFTGAVGERQGVFEAANGGTIFLDEIGDVPPSVQTSLLRVLQEREITRVGETTPRSVDVRIVAATNRDLAAEVEAGRFRADLYYRVRVAPIQLPPLRDRDDDIRLLATHFIATLRPAKQRGVSLISDPALSLLRQHDWPGNVRELKSALEFASIRCRSTTIVPCDLPPELRVNEADGAVPASADERGRIRWALEQTGGQRTAAAKLLGMSRATFYRRLASLDIEPDP